MKSENFWYRSAGEGWSPTLYDWFFYRTKRGLALRSGEEEVVYRLLEGGLRPDSRIVEYGPGTRHYTLPLARRCASVVAVEPSAEMREHLGERLAREGIDNVEIRDGLIEGGPGSPDRFDGALAVGPLYYVRDLLPALSAVGAGLKPGGWGVFTVPLRSLEGTWQLVSELLARRHAFLRSPAEATLTAERAGLEVLGTGLTGTSRGGLSLVLKTVTPSEPLSSQARDARPQVTS